MIEIMFNCCICNYKTIMAHIKKVHMTDEIEADYEISLEKDNREPYL